MRHDRVASIAGQPDHLPQAHLLPRADLDAARLQMSVDGITPLTEIENDRIAIHRKVE